MLSIRKLAAIALIGGIIITVFRWYALIFVGIVALVYLVRLMADAYWWYVDR